MMSNKWPYPKKTLFSPDSAGRTTPGEFPNSVSHSVNMFSNSFVRELNVYLFNLSPVQTETERDNGSVPFFFFFP